MNTIVANVLRHESKKTQAAVYPLAIIALFCALGLFASISMMSYGLDISAGFF
jgi:hypothetical protein